MPKINTCETTQITQNSVVIKVPLYDEEQIINKNKYNITNCLERFGKTKIEYVVYFYDRDKNCYDKKIFPKKKKILKTINLK